MRRKWAHGLLVLICAFGSAEAQQLNKFQELGRAMQGHLRPMSELDPNHKIIDCSQMPPESLAGMIGSTVSQYIYNHSYEWKTIPLSGGDCVFLRRPFKRGLTVEEMQMLISASMREWPVDNTPPLIVRPKDDLNGSKPISPRQILPDKMEHPNPNAPPPCKKGGQDCGRAWMPASALSALILPFERHQAAGPRLPARAA